MHAVYVHLSAAQQKKADRGQGFQLGHDAIRGAFSDDPSEDSSEMHVTEAAAHRLHESVRKGKGHRFHEGDVLETSGGSLKSVWRTIRKHAGSAINALKKIIPQSTVKAALEPLVLGAAAYTGNPALGTALNGALDKGLSTAYAHDYNKPINKKSLARGVANAAANAAVDAGYIDPATGGSIGSTFRSIGRKIKGVATTVGHDIVKNRKTIVGLVGQTAISALAPGFAQPALDYGLQQGVNQMGGNGLQERAQAAQSLAKGEPVRRGKRIIMPEMAPGMGNVAIPVAAASEGRGLKRPAKGSPEMREYMAKLRGMRKGRGSGIAPYGGGGVNPYGH